MTRLLRYTRAGLIAQDPDDEVPSWVFHRHVEFRDMVSAREGIFPCYFATTAELSGTLRYSYLKPSECHVPHALGSALVQYLAEHPRIKGRSALIVFVSTGEHDGYEQCFWDLVHALHTTDPEPWPADVPLDPDEPSWTFCFAGMPIFIAGHAPSYRQRRSRHSASDLLLVIQPRSNLAGIVGHGTTAVRVRKRIHSLLDAYDEVAPSPDLGVYDDADTREWRQYWLTDTNTAARTKCPLELLSASGEQTHSRL